MNGINYFIHVICINNKQKRKYTYKIVIHISNLPNLYFAEIKQKIKEKFIIYTYFIELFSASNLYF